MFDWKLFIKAGRAILTIENIKTGNRFTFKVTKCQDKDIWFVSVLSGPNNSSDYQYLGTIFDKNFRLTRKSRIKETAQSYQVFKWMNDILNANGDLPEEVKIYHEGFCGICGKRLTVPESIECGFGPVCISRPNSHIPLETAKQIQQLFKLNKELNNESASSTIL